jgi:acetoin utilization deacetylase AcuC-like enzyme
MTAIYTDARCLDHYAPEHPESPDRLRAATTALQGLGDALRWPTVTPADPATVAAVHGERHVRRIAGIAEAGGGWVDPDTFVAPSSYPAALSAVGATLQATADVLAGREPNALVVVRPPGHHATRERSMGFCLFNNVAIAAQWAVAEGSAGRVAILDIDVHHGNGTQEIFFDRPDILYYSTHQYPYYPGTGGLDEVGARDGRGTTVNVPLMAGCGDHTFLAVTDRVLLPAIRRFAPELVFVSLGFDAHWADPLAGMRLSLNGYGAIIQRISALATELCGGRLVLLLEGGYDLRVIAGGVRAAAHILLDEEPDPDPLGPPPTGYEPERAQDVIGAARAIHDLPPAGAE